MAARDVKFLANLGLHGSLRFLESNADFPVNPVIGDMLLKGTELYAYIKIGDLETWVPVSNRTNSYIHTQGIAQLDWTVTHNLGTTDVWTQIRDSNNDIVYAAMDNITANSFQLHFTEAITGTVIVVAPDSLDVPAVTTTMINVGNVQITGSNITINGQPVLTGGSFATVATTGLFADLLSKPTSLAGYGITDAQPLDADLSAIAALSGTGFAKRTGVDTWVLDNSNYITGNQNITVSGDASGSGTTSISLTLSDSGVSAGTYKSVTVDAKGRVTGGSNPTTLAGFGITDAAPLSHVGSGGATHAQATTASSGFMSPSDKTKLDGIESGANNYVLPVADIDTLGGVKDGAGVTIDVDGTLSANVLSVAGKIGNVALDKSDVGLDNVENKSSATIRSELTSGNVTAALGYSPENPSNKNTANGYAGLDAGGKLLTSQLPAIAITDTFVVASQSAMLALSAETGDVAVRPDLNKSFILKGTSPSTLADWQELLTPTDQVQSVNGMAGVVTVSTISGNAGSATVLQTARTLTVGNTGKSFDGSDNVSWSLSEIGAQPEDADLSAIAALVGTTGFLKKTAANTWSLDTNSYSLDTHTHSSIINGTSSVDIPSADGSAVITVGGVAKATFASGTTTLSNILSVTGGAIEVSNGTGIGNVNVVGRNTDGFGSVQFRDNTNTSTNARIIGRTNALAIEVAASERINIDSTGKVGISNQVPEYQLDIKGAYSATSGTGVRIQTNGSYGEVLNLGRSGISGSASITYPTDNTFAVATGGTERVRISSTGNFGIATTSPQARLHVIGTSGQVRFENTSASDARHEYRRNGVIEGMIQWDANLMSIGAIQATGAVTFWAGGNGAEKMRITSAGNVLIGTTSDDGINKLQVSGGTSFVFSSTDRMTLNYNTNDTTSKLVLMYRRGTGAGSAAIGQYVVGDGSNGVSQVRFTSDTSNVLTIGRTNVLIGTATDDGINKLQISGTASLSGDNVVIATAKTPASATATGTTGMVCWDSNYIYVCVATNTWKRTALSTW